MKKTKILLCYFFAILMFVLSLSTTAIANDFENSSVDDSSFVSDESKKMFAKLYFTSLDDINKILLHYSSNKSVADIKNSIASESTTSIINNLNLNTTYEETNCILNNISVADSYVKSKVALLISAKNIIDPFGENPVVSPNFSSGIHKNRTITLAKKYFSTDIANNIGYHDDDVDVKYSSVTGFIFGSSQQYVHFNEYTDGNDSREYIAAMWNVAAKLAWNEGNKTEAYMYLGYSLHPVQDKESHGQIDAGAKRPHHLFSVNGDNRNHADDETGWEWTDSKNNRLKKVTNSTVRRNKSDAVTTQFLKDFKDYISK